MENIKNNTPENPERKEQLGGKEKLEVILALFGTDSAREAFVETCRKYIEARDRAVRESYAPVESVRRRAVMSSPKQAVLHNKIMDALTRLASQSLNISPLQSEVLREMHNRDTTAQIIREYVAFKGATDVVDEDDEDEGGRKKGMSDTAYYHSLGKGD
jgi:hypothetical protein